MQQIAQPVISGARFFLAHAPGLVRYGSKPSRDIARDVAVLDTIRSHLRSYEQAVAYPPNQTFLGHLHPDDLTSLSKPWFTTSGQAERWGPHGEIMPEESFYGLLKICDAFDLVQLEAGFVEEIRPALKAHPLLTTGDLAALGPGLSTAELAALLERSPQALALELRSGRRIGLIHAAHDVDTSLAADVLLENLCCKATAVMAMRTLLAQQQIDPNTIPYLLNSGEEAVGDRYQRGGGNLAKAVAEMSHCQLATGVDIKGFCCGPVHALMLAGSLVSSRVYDQVAVIGGCSLAKLGMKYQGHVKHDQPVLEDVLAGAAIIVRADDGRSPLLRLDAVGRHTVAAGSSQKAIFEHLVSQPLSDLGLRFSDIDKYATELHNPEVTEPAGTRHLARDNKSGNARHAPMAKEIAPSGVANFLATQGKPRC
jgi:betaine reductase